MTSEESGCDRGGVLAQKQSAVRLSYIQPIPLLVPPQRTSRNVLLSENSLVNVTPVFGGLRIPLHLPHSTKTGICITKLLFTEAKGKAR